MVRSQSRNFAANFKLRQLPTPDAGVQSQQEHVLRAAVTVHRDTEGCHRAMVRRLLVVYRTANPSAVALQALDLSRVCIHHVL